MDKTLTVGELVRDGLGHWLEVKAVLSPWLYKVQPLTPVGTELRPLGGLVTAGRSELRKNGE
jgi:hypothetical protein